MMIKILHKCGRKRTEKKRSTCNKSPDILFFRRPWKSRRKAGPGKNRRNSESSGLASFILADGMEDAMGQQALAGEIGIQAQDVGNMGRIGKIEQKQHQIRKIKEDGAEHLKRRQSRMTPQIIGDGFPHHQGNDQGINLDDAGHNR